MYTKSELQEIACHTTTREPELNIMQTKEYLIKPIQKKHFLFVFILSARTQHFTKHFFTFLYAVRDSDIHDSNS